MLLRQDRRRHQHRHLLAVHHRLERGADRHLGLPIPDVAGHQPVHRARGLHVPLDLLDRLPLVGSLFVGERFFHLPLPRRVGGKGVAGPPLARRVELQELPGHFPRPLPDAALLPLPLRPAQPVNLRRLSLHADIPLDEIDLVGRDVQRVPLRVLEVQIVALSAPHGEPFEPPVDADAVVDVHDEVAGG